MLYIEGCSLGKAVANLCVRVCLVFNVRLLSRSSRSMHFGYLTKTNVMAPSERVTQNAHAAGIKRQRSRKGVMPRLL